MFINVKVIFLFQHSDLEMFPKDLNVLIDMKFAIKIKVNNYNIQKNCFVYGISKLTDDENILNELEMRFNAQRVIISGKNYFFDLLIFYCLTFL